MIDVSIFSFLIKGPGGDEESLEEVIEPTPPKDNITTKSETQRTQ